MAKTMLRSMLTAICVAASLLVVAPRANCQSETGSQSTPPQAPSGSDSDQTLEIPQRATQSPPPAESEQPQPEGENESSSPENGSAEATAPNGGAALPSPDTNPAAPRRERPYLGIAVQYVESHDRPGRDVHGLEIVSVNENSPAQRAGLRPRGPLTELGATGATAGALMAPLDIVVMPLLKKSGQLGGTGDLIVAIDDKRVDSENVLTDELDESKPGDTIYFTVVRANKDGSYDTLKIPVKLGKQPVADTVSAARAPSQAEAASSPPASFAGSNAPAR